MLNDACAPALKDAVGPMQMNTWLMQMSKSGYVVQYTACVVFKYG